MSATQATEATPPLPDGYRRLPGSERKPARGAQRVNSADPDEVLTVSVYVRRNPEAPPLTEMEHWMTTPPGRRQFLTREDMAAVHGAAEADLEAVIQFGREPRPDGDRDQPRPADGGVVRDGQADERCVPRGSRPV